MFTSISKHTGPDREFGNQKNRELSKIKWDATPDPKVGRKCIACRCMRNEEELDTEYKVLYCQYCGIQLLYDRHQISDEIGGAMIAAAFVFGFIGVVLFSFLSGLLLASIPIVIFFFFRKRLIGRLF